MKHLSKVLIFIAIFLLTCLAFAAPLEKSDIQGNWIGGFKLEDKWVFIDANFEMEKGELKATIDLPFENESSLVPTQVNFKLSRMQFNLPNGSGTLLFDGLFNGATISGTVKLAEKEGAFHLFRICRTN